MYRDNTVGVVVPAYNEAGFVGDVIDDIPAFVDQVYAVDDCSTDDTWAEVSERADETRQVKPGRDPSPRTETDGGDIDSQETDRRDTDWEEADSQRTATDATATERRGLARGRRDHGRRQRVREWHGNGSGGEADGQTGATADSVAAEQDRESATFVVAIRHQQNAGVGGAVQTGYRAALADEMDVTAVVNGDGQMDPTILDRFLDPIVTGEADYVKGNRLTTPTDRASMSGWRLFGNALLTFLTKVASGYWKMTDPQNGYTAISLRALAALDIDALYDDYGFCNDMLVRLNVHRFRVANVRMEAIYGEEESGIAYSSFVPKLSLLLLTGFLWRLKRRYVVADFHPLVLLYGLGVGGMLAGVAYGIGATLADTPLALVLPLSALLVLCGGLLLVLGMTFDMLYNDHLERSAQLRPYDA